MSGTETKMHPRREAVVNRLIEMEEDAGFFDGFEDAILGLAVQYTGKPRVAYDREKCLEIIMKRRGVDRKRAEELFKTIDQPLVVYDRDRCIQVLMERDEMSHEEAEEFFQFNTECAWFGEMTPMILDRCEEL